MIATLPPAGVFLPVAVSADHFYYRGRGCGTHEVRIEVHVADPGAVASVGLFFRLRNQVEEGTTDWNDGVAMTPGCGGDWGWVVHAGAGWGAGRRGEKEEECNARELKPQGLLPAAFGAGKPNLPHNLRAKGWSPPRAPSGYRGPPSLSGPSAQRTPYEREA